MFTRQFRPYPLKFRPIPKEKIWGGNQIETLYRKGFPDGLPIGESWELCDHFDDVSVISHGLYEGINLHDLMVDYPSDLLGVAHSSYKRFPIIVKILDPNDKLSIQVHPDDKYVNSHPEIEAAKTEMWYVAKASPNARIILGNKPSVSKNDLVRALESGTLSHLLNYIDIKAFHSYPIYAGTIHALLPGSIIFEIQQNSDVTFRLYDWGRVGDDGKPRKLHLEQALDVINLSPQLVFIEQVSGNFSKLIFKSHIFDVFEYHLVSSSVDIATESFQILSFVEGNGFLLFQGGEGRGVSRIAFVPGDTVLIPASLPIYTIDPKSETRFLLTKPV